MSRDEGSVQDLAPLGREGSKGGAGIGSPEGALGRDGDGDSPDRSGGRGSACVEESLPPFVARDAGQLLDLALEILRDNFLVIAGTCVLVWIPARVLEPIVGSTTLFDDQGSMQDTQAALLGLAGIGLTAFTQILVQALASALVARLVYAALHGERLPLRVALGQASRSVIGLIVIALITAVATTVGCCLFFVPFVYLHWKLSLAPTIYVLEDAGIGESLTRSFALTPGSFLRWLTIVVVVFCLTIPFSGLVAVQPQVRALILDSLAISGGVFDAVMILLSSIFMGLATAIASVTLTLFYLDCRVRREGYDVRRALSEMRAGLAPARTAAGEST